MHFYWIPCISIACYAFSFGVYSFSMQFHAFSMELRPFSRLGHACSFGY